MDKNKEEEYIKQIEELENENKSLRKRNFELRNKLDSRNRRINRMIDDEFNQVHLD
jgi:hypothetical protein